MKKRWIAVRFDDICPTMNWKEFNKAIELMEMYHIRPLLGVIPENQDENLLIGPEREDYWDYLKQLQNRGYTLAMHGTHHKYHYCKEKGMVCGGTETEFVGMSYKEQFNLIKEGKKILEEHGINTTIFFAPSHSYDRNTLKALAANGFQYISDGKSMKPYTLDGITCIPCTSFGIPKPRKRGIYVAVNHAHEWVREDKKEAWTRLENLCEDYSTEIVSFEELMKIPQGNTVVQYFLERCRVFYLRNIRPTLVSTYHKINNGVREKMGSNGTN